MALHRDSHRSGWRPGCSRRPLHGRSALGWRGRSNWAHF